MSCFTDPYKFYLGRTPGLTPRTWARAMNRLFQNIIPSKIMTQASSRNPVIRHVLQGSLISQITFALVCGIVLAVLAPELARSARDRRVI